MPLASGLAFGIGGQWWTEIEDALHAAVVSGSGLPTTQVIWAGQQSPRPVEPYIAMNFVSVVHRGQDWVDVHETFTEAGSVLPMGVGSALGGVENQQIEYRARGMRQAVLSIQCFSSSVFGADSARAILSQTMTALRLPSIREGLTAGGVGVGTSSPIRVLPGLVGGQFEPRGQVDLTLHLAEEIAEVGSYIEKVEITNENTSTTQTVELP